MNGKRIALAVGAGVVATGAVVASAASLGSIATDEIGASTEVVAACQDEGLAVAWGAPNYSANDAGSFVTSSVDLSGVSSDCQGRPYKLQLANDAGVAQGTLAAGNLANAATTSIAVNDANVENVEKLVLTIY